MSSESDYENDEITSSSSEEELLAQQEIMLKKLEVLKKTLEG